MIGEPQLAGSRAQLDAEAGALLDRETLTGDELDALAIRAGAGSQVARKSRR